MLKIFSRAGPSTRSSTFDVPESAGLIMQTGREEFAQLYCEKGTSIEIIDKTGGDTIIHAVGTEMPIVLIPPNTIVRQNAGRPRGTWVEFVTGRLIRA